MAEQRDETLNGQLVDRQDRNADDPSARASQQSSAGEGAQAPSGAISSLALRDIPVPDYCDVVIVPTRGVAIEDPRVWAEAIFSHENTPLSTRGLRALRDEAVRLFDMVPPPEKQYVADEVRGSEALIKDDDQNLSLRIGVALLPGGELLQVTTAVKYRSVRGRLAWAPRRLMHAAAVNALARRAPTTVRRRQVGPRTTGPAQLSERSERRSISRGRFLGRAGGRSTDRDA
ncbi:hypothetical protein DEO23_12865 [Brachybacterium endophyticum]|uniref:DUF2867 domain-containing protein n=1 Tax=Brachybacterium endophyticum TaxID=2182385 RepID=A0A2U2RHY0_9MICO|nr:DUF2867 domain-containing protein [Brachybacterium endophyticum]PWH05460.1 hypothetical protein DEO23_12865 [Brachybacterium endophyticum]